MKYLSSLLLGFLFFLPSTCLGWSANPWNNQCNCETINYSEYSIADWVFRDEFATCGDIFNAIDDSTIDFADLPTEENIGAGDWLLLKKANNVTSKIDALVFQNEMNSVLPDFGDNTTIVNPEDDFTTVFINTTFPHTFIFTPGTHTLNISGIVDLEGSTFMGFGRDYSTLEINPDSDTGDYIKLVGTNTVQDLTVEFVSTTGENFDFWVAQGDDDTILNIINSTIKKKMGGTGAKDFLRTYNNSANTTISLDNSEIITPNSLTGYLIRPNIGADDSPIGILLKNNSTIQGKLNLNSASHNSFTVINSVVKNEVTFSRLGEMVSQYYHFSNAHFEIPPVYIGRGAPSLFEHLRITMLGDSNTTIPITTGPPITMSLSEYLQAFLQIYRTSVFDNIEGKILLDLKCTDTDPTIELLDFKTIKLYLTDDSNDVRIQTGFDGSGDPVYTIALAGTLSIIETIPRNTTFPTFPSSGDDLKVYRKITTW